MKVLLLMLSPPAANGGMEKHFSDLANGLANAGVSVSCMSAAEHLQSLDSRILRYPVNTNASRYSVPLIRSIVNAQRRQKFDIIHAQGSKAAATIQPLSAILPTPRYIATIHNFKSRYPSPKRFSAIIAVSHALARDIGQSTTVVYNGIRVDTQKAPPCTLDVCDHPIWLAVGRLVHAKGFDHLIDAFVKVKGTLLIAGDGEEREPLQKKVEQLRLADRVKLLGYQAQIPRLMQSVDAIVISSRREGFSYVCAEALLAGKPIISTDVPVANELLPPQHICPIGDIDTLAALLNTPIPELEETQATTRDYAARELTIDAMIENTLRVYQEVIRDE
ncbi:glycosyltransferase [Marinobacter sp. VGCF2001]|uniref:glycosyltransferase n=1 Tax=Marinobacter sp. VGCF2001 TaxID=3417189 RepID=UPI003CEB5169